MDNEATAEGGSDNIRDLRQAADEGRKAKAEFEQAKREIAFLRAGVDTTSKLGAMFFKSYDGDLSTEAIKAEATELGMFQTPAAPEVPQAEREFSQARMDLASEAGTPAAHEEDPYVTSRKSWEDARGEGATLQEAFGAAMGPLLQAAHRGDQRVSGNRTF